MDKKKHYSSLNRDEKRRARETIDKIEKASRGQLDLIEENILRPIKHVIQAGKDYKKGLMSFERYELIVQKKTKMIKIFFGV